ncbi:MAG: ATP citrate lyase citrate-binding domain-containing protein [Candidatus Dojkabacteria bacterium]
MAQKAIREYFGKKLIYRFLPEFFPDFNQEYSGVSINKNDLGKIKIPTVEDGYIVKPDELFGKRGKNNLIYKAKSPEDVKTWIKDKTARSVTITRGANDPGIKDTLQTFIVEPFVKHDNEFYVAIKTEREGNILYISNRGGVDVEKNWDDVLQIKLPFSKDASPLSQTIRERITSYVKGVEGKKFVVTFISALHELFTYLDFTYLEINPFTVVDNKVYILDLVARLDSTALYHSYSLWSEAGEVEFPKPFGDHNSKAEDVIEELDEKSGASLKLKILNPEGRIWMLTSGGGGSVIFADTVGDLGHAGELANYGEYSGNPTTDETEAYAGVVLGEMLQSNAKNKVLIIGGGIANFTDVKKTFTGVVRAIQTKSKQMKAQKIKVYVRRGGPNHKEGLEMIETEVKKMGIPIEVHGPETYMTEIIKIALK